MPIYEYECAKCGRRFEKLVIGSRGSENVHCDVCGDSNVNRVMSTFSAKSSNAGIGGGGGSSCAPSAGGFT